MEIALFTSVIAAASWPRFACASARYTCWPFARDRLAIRSLTRCRRAAGCRRLRRHDRRTEQDCRGGVAECDQSHTGAVEPVLPADRSGRRIDAEQLAGGARVDCIRLNRERDEVRALQFAPPDLLAGHRVQRYNVAADPDVEAVSRFRHRNSPGRSYSIRRLN